MIKPSRGYVLIEPEKEDKTASGLVIPENAQEKPQKGIIINLGIIPIQQEKMFLEYGTKDWKTEFNIGDRVYFKRWGGETIKEDGKEYQLVKFEDMLATIE